MYCTNCGKEHVETDKFCMSCGREIRNEAAVASEMEMPTHKKELKSEEHYKEPMPPGAILAVGLVLSYLVGGIMAFINIRRYNYKGVTALGISAVLLSFLAFVFLMGAINPESPVFIGICFAVVCNFAIFIHQRTMYAVHFRDNVPSIQLQKKLKKVLWIIITLSLLVISLVLFLPVKDYGVIQFGTGHNSSGVTGISSEFSSESEINMFIELNEPFAVSRIHFLLTKETSTGNTENIIHEWEESVDPTWNLYWYQLKQSGTFLESGNYHLKLLINDEVIAHGSFKIK